MIIKIKIKNKDEVKTVTINPCRREQHTSGLTKIIKILIVKINIKYQN